jgi:hypothetical protein
VIHVARVLPPPWPGSAQRTHATGAFAPAALAPPALSLIRILTLFPTLFLASAIAPAPAAAHSRPLSYSFLRAHGERVDVRLQIASADLTRMGFDLAASPAQSERAGQLLQRSLRISAQGSACVPLAPASPSASNHAGASRPWIAWHWSVRCPGDGEHHVHADFGALLRGGHRHLVRFEHAGDGPAHGHAVERVLELGADEWALDSAGRSGSTLLDYGALGVEHMLTGWDHLVFVLALLLLATRLRDLVWLVTSFTLAHSLSLALAVLHVVKPETAPVEALIGFSIALLGIENGWLLAGRGRSTPVLVTLGLLALAALGAGSVGRLALAGLALFCACHFALLRRAREPAGLRTAVAFAFGLIHGFGFAAVLSELALPGARVAQALLGFNLGVELGQLAVVLLVWPLLRALERVRDGRPARLIAEAASAAVAGLGLFWFATRAFG